MPNDAWRARSPVELLERLVTAGVGGSVVVHLASGRDLRGIPIDSGARGTMVAIRADRRQVTCVPAAAIEAVTVDDLEEILEPPAPPVSRLEVRRMAARLAERLGELGFAIAIESSAEHNPRAARAIERIGAALEGVAADELGRAALAAIERIELRDGEVDRLGRDGATLVVELGSDRGAAEPELTAQLEAVL